jgi:hypothetical protein
MEQLRSLQAQRCAGCFVLHFERKEHTMELFATIVRYGFVVALAVEAVLVGYALLRLAREKARPAEVVIPQE